MIRGIKPTPTTTKFGKELVYNFNTNSKLEIQTTVKRPFGGVRKNWMTVSPNVFRSYHGKRKVDGITFKGLVYYWLSNQLYRSPSTKSVVNGFRITIIRKPHNNKPVHLTVKPANWRIG